MRACTYLCVKLKGEQHRQILHSTFAAILNFSKGHVPGYTLNNLDRDRRLQVQSPRQMGDLHSKVIIRNISEGHQYPDAEVTES